MDERDFMERAVSISREMMRGLKGGPFGAVVVKAARSSPRGTTR